MLNSVVMIGNITNDIELTKSSDGLSILKLIIACTRDRKDKNGEYVTDFSEWKLFGNVADYVSNYGSKGDKVAIKGRYIQDKWLGEDGKNKYKQYFIADTVQLIVRKKQTTTNDNYNNATEQIEEELPF